MSVRDTIPSLDVVARSEIDTEPKLRLLPRPPRLPDVDAESIERVASGIHHAQGEASLVDPLRLQGATWKRISRAQELLEEAQRVLLGEDTDQ